MRHPITTIGLMVGAALGALAGCSSAPDLGPVFNDEGARPIACLTHQTEDPGTRYTDREQRNTGQVLALMRYYTAHGTKPYCDAAPADETDQAWARTYLDLGGTSAKVTGVLR